MKKYIKPTANIVELSVKENLSALPSGFTKPRASNITKRTAYVVTTYAKTSNGTPSAS